MHFLLDALMHLLVACFIYVPSSCILRSAETHRFASWVYLHFIFRFSISNRRVWAEYLSGLFQCSKHLQLI